MVNVIILKNGNVLRQFICTKETKQKYFELAFDIAGGLWNGVDSFKVVINEF